MKWTIAWTLPAALLAALAARGATAPPPSLVEVLDLPPERVRLVFFQPADCEFRRRAIVREIVESGAIPVVLYAGSLAPDDLGRLLGEGMSGVPVRRLPEVGLERVFRERGIRATPFVLELDAAGAIDEVITRIGGSES